MAWFIPITTKLAAFEFAALFYKNIKLKYRSSKDIVSDQDTRITFKFWAKVCSYSLIKRRLSIAFYLQTNSQTKILNQALKGYL